MLREGFRDLKDKFDREDSIVFREPERISRESLELASRYGSRAYIVERFIEVMGYDETLMLLEWNEKPLPETIRCNDYLVDCLVLSRSLGEKGFKVSSIPWLPHGLEVSEGPFSVGATHEYLKGYYYIQDPGSMLPVYIMDPRPGDTIIDVAAAPGGKATQILQLTRDGAKLIAVDVSRARIRALRSHMQRMGFKSYIALRTDSRLLPRIVGRRVADRVLVDAPSSGEGIIRKDPSRKSSRAPSDLRVIHYLQLELLLASIELVDSGGDIVYAACSTAPEEGELVIDRVLRLRGDVEVSPTRWNGIGSPGITAYKDLELNSSVKNCLRLWPHRDGTEGFFICRLKRLE